MPFSELPMCENNVPYQEFVPSTAIHGSKTLGVSTEISSALGMIRLDLQRPLLGSLGTMMIFPILDV